MTVETETVSSIPQAASSNAGDRAGALREGGGTLRSKASSETIRPKKEKKRVVKKPPSLVSGAGKIIVTVCYGRRFLLSFLSLRINQSRHF